jgi:hypothetical protein
MAVNVILVGVGVAAVEQGVVGIEPVSTSRRVAHGTDFAS